MLKKFVSVLLSVLMIFSSMNAVFAASATVEDAPLRIIVEEDFSQYIGKNDCNITDAYPKDASDNVIVTGTGWATNWISNPDDTTTTDVTKVLFKNGDADRQGNAISLKYDSTSIIYRKLANTIDFSTGNAKYVFSFNVMDNSSSFTEGKGNLFRFRIGNVLQVGYNYDGTTDPTKIQPVVVVGSQTYTAATGGDGTGSLTTNGGWQFGSYTHFELAINIKADGIDTITLKAYDRPIEKQMNNNIVVQPDEIVTITQALELSNKECSYIGIGTGDYHNNHLVNGIEIGCVNNYDAVESAFNLNTDVVATDKLSTLEYKGSWTNIVNGYKDGVTNPGVGWQYGWSTSPNTCIEPVDADKIQILQVNLKRNIDSTDSPQKTLAFEGAPVGTVAYRKFTNPITLGVSDTKYVFSLDLQDGMTVPAARKDFRYYIGDSVYVGHDRVDSGNKIKPFIGIAQGSPGENDDIKVYSDFAITVNGGHDYGKFVHYEVAIVTANDGLSNIIFKVQDRQNYQVSGAWANVSDEVASVAYAANLSGKSVSYIGVGSTSTVAFKFKLQNIEVKSSQVDAYNITRKNSVVYKTTDGKNYTPVTTFSDIASSDTVRVVTSYANAGKGTNKFHAVTYWYNGKLMNVKINDDTINQGNVQVINDDCSFDAASGWPATDFDGSKLQIKVFSWKDISSITPIVQAAEFNTQGELLTEHKFMYVDSSYNGESTYGSETMPYKTLEQATNAIRQLKLDGEYPNDGVTVIMKGDYFYPNTYFNASGASISGDKYAPVTYEGRDGARIIGGVRLELSDFVSTTEDDLICGEGIKKYTVPTSVMSFDSGYPIGGMARSYFGMSESQKSYYNLIFNEDMMRVARYPNQGWLKVDRVISSGDWECRPPSGGMEFTASDIDGTPVDTARWAADRDIAVHGYFSVDFSDLATPAEITANGSILTKYNCGKDPTLNTGSRRFVMLNSPKELDAPGEWYIDRTSNTVYFMPPYGEKSGEIIISTNPYQLVKVSDTNNVHFKNIKTIGGLHVGIYASNSNCIYIDKCNFFGQGGIAINSTGVSDCIFHGNTISNSGQGGIWVRGGSLSEEQKGNNYIVNNTIHDYSRVNWTYSPAVNLDGYANLVSNNVIYNSPHMAIQMFGNDNVISYNKISDVLKETSDMGAIYFGKRKSQRGNIIEYNYFHDLKTDSALSNGVDISAIFADDIADGYIVRKNIFKDITGRSFRTNGGRCFEVTDNVFINVSTNAAFTRVSNSSISRYWEMLSVDPVIAEDRHRYEPFTKYPHLPELLEDDPLEPKYNVFKNNYSYGGGEDLKLTGVYDDVIIGYSSASALDKAKLVEKYYIEELSSDFSASTLISYLQYLKAEKNDYSDFNIDFSQIGLRQYR